MNLGQRLNNPDRIDAFYHDQAKLRIERRRPVHHEWRQAAPNGRGDGTRAGLEILAGLLVIGMWGVAFVLWASILAVTP